MSAVSRLLTSNVSLLLEELPSASSQCEAANGDEFSQFLFHWKCLPSPPSLKDIFGGCRRLGWLWHYRCLDSDEKWLIIFIFVLHVSGVICFCCFLWFFFSNLIFNNHTGSWCGFLVCILLGAYWAPWNCWLTLCIKFGMFSASSSDIFSGFFLLIYGTPITLMLVAWCFSTSLRLCRFFFSCWLFWSTFFFLCFSLDSFYYSIFKFFLFIWHWLTKSTKF